MLKDFGVGINRWTRVLWYVLMCVATYGRNLFPSVLLQPLGHLSVFRINRLQRRLNRQSPELCQTLQCLAITYEHSSIAAEEESAEPVDAHRLRDMGSQLGVPSSN